MTAKGKKGTQVKFRLKTGGKGANASRKQVLAQQKSARAKQVAASTAKRAGTKGAVKRKATGSKRVGTSFIAKPTGGTALAGSGMRNEVKTMIDSVRGTGNRSQPSFDRDALQRVHDGLVETMQAMADPSKGDNGDPHPNKFFGLSITMLSSPAVLAWQIPYLATILAASIGKVSHNVLRSRQEKLVEIIQKGLQSDNYLVIHKSMKVAQAIAIALPPTDEHVSFIKRFMPNRQNGTMMPLYLTMIRKWLVHCFESKDLFAFFFDQLVNWVNYFCETMSEGKESVIYAAKNELKQLLLRTAKFEMVKEYADNWNQVMGSLASVFKNVAHRGSWNLALEVIRDFFEAISFVKRSRLVEEGGEDISDSVFETVFPHGAVLLKVVDRIRCLDDDRHNGLCDQAITAMGRCMTVAEFTRILPFDPHSAMDALETEDQNDVLHGVQDEEDVLADSDDDEGLGVKIRRRGGPKDKRTKKIDDIWRRSYVMGILRRISSHDSLPFAAQFLLPRIADCEQRISLMVSARRNAEATQWTVLHEQYWRVMVGFCHFPHKITSESFVAVAKEMVELLKTPHLANVAATGFHVLCGGMYKLSQAEGLDPDLFDESDPEAMALKQEMLQDETADPLAYHGFTKEDCLNACEIFRKFSRVIMPKLCNAFEDVDTTAVLDAITSFSRVCSDSVMNTVLQGIMDVGKNIAQEQADGVSASKKISNQRRVILDIASSMIVSLSSDHLYAIYTDIVEPVLQDQSGSVSPALQKKAYKLLLGMFDHRLKDIHPELERILGVLLKGQDHVTAAGLKMRLKCLYWAIDAYKMYNPESLDKLFDFAVPEITLCAKQPSNAVRTATMEIVEKMHLFTMNGNGNPHSLLEKVLAGLAGLTPMLVCGSIVITAKLLWIGHNDYQPEYISRIINAIAGLVASVVPEVRTSAATFMKMCLKLMKKSQKVEQGVQSSLQELCQNIAIVISQPKVSSGTRTAMHALMENCIKRFGQENVEQLTPEGAHKFVAHIGKSLRRTERLKLRSLHDDDEVVNRPGEDLFAEAFLQVEDGEDAIDAGDDLLEDGGLGRLVSNNTRPGKLFTSDVEEEVGGVTVRFDGDKLKILSQEEREEEDQNKRRQEMIKRRAAVNARTLSVEEAIRGVRKDDDVVDFENEEIVRLHGTDYDFQRAMDLAGDKRAAPSSATQASREQAMEHRERKRQRLEASGVKTGDEFSSGKALGDVKKGNVDPFAYVPLHPRFLNKRHARERTDRLRVLTANRGLRGEKAARALANMKGVKQ